MMAAQDDELTTLQQRVTVAVEILRHDAEHACWMADNLDRFLDLQAARIAEGRFEALVKALWLLDDTITSRSTSRREAIRDEIRTAAQDQNDYYEQLWYRATGSGEGR